MSDSLQSSSSPSSSISLPSSSSSTTSTFTNSSMPPPLHLHSPSSSSSSSPLVASLQSILSEFQRVDSERTALQSRLSVLEQQAKERDDEVRLLKKQVEVLQYGVRCERAMRMGEGSRDRGRLAVGTAGGGRGKENIGASTREERKAAGDVVDEKEQLLLKAESATDSQPAAKAMKGRARGKAAPLQPNYFTLPSRLPASPMSARAMLMWRDYIQTEGSKLDLDLTALKEGKRCEDDTEGKQAGKSHMFPSISSSQTASANTRPRSPALPAAEPTAAATTPRAGILGGKAKAGTKRMKKLQFKEEVERVEAGDDDQAVDDSSEEKDRKSIASIFTPPTAVDDKDNTSSPTALQSQASSSASLASRTASTSSSSSSSSPASKSVFSTLASNAAYRQLRPKLTLRHHVAGVRAIAFDSSSSLSTSAPSILVSASDDCTVQVWNMSAQLPTAGSASSSSIAAKKQAAKPLEPVSTFRHTHPVLSVALHLESSRLVAGTVGGGVEVWEATSTGAVGGLYGANVGWAGKLGGWQVGGAVWSVTMEEKGDVVVCASADGNVYVYSMTAIGSAPLHIIPSPTASSRPTSLTYLSSEHLVAAYTGGELAVIDVSTGSVVTRSTTASYITSVAANAFHLFTAHVDGSIQLHDLHTLAASSPPVKAHTDCVTSISCHPTSAVLASCGHDETVRVWDVRDGGMRVLQCLEPHSTHRSVMDEAVHCVRWNEEGRLASSGADGLIKVYV